jgi:hypothetical protein
MWGSEFSQQSVLEYRKPKTYERPVHDKKNMFNVREMGAG